MWTGILWLKTGTCYGLFCTRCWTFRFLKCGEFLTSWGSAGISRRTLLYWDVSFVATNLRAMKQRMVTGNRDIGSRWVRSLLSLSSIQGSTQGGGGGCNPPKPAKTEI
jgi:hypothetical protein